MEDPGTREHLVVVEELVLLVWGQTDDPVRHQQIKEQLQKGHQGEALLHTLLKKIMLVRLLVCLLYQFSLTFSLMFYPELDN